MPPSVALSNVRTSTRPGRAASTAGPDASPASHTPGSNGVQPRTGIPIFYFRDLSHGATISSAAASRGGKLRPKGCRLPCRAMKNAIVATHRSICSLPNPRTSENRVAQPGKRCGSGESRARENVPRRVYHRRPGSSRRRVEVIASVDGGKPRGRITAQSHADHMPPPQAANARSQGPGAVASDFALSILPNPKSGISLRGSVRSLLRTTSVPTAPRPSCLTRSSRTFTSTR